MAACVCARVCVSTVPRNAGEPDVCLSCGFVASPPPPKTSRLKRRGLKGRRPSNSVTLHISLACGRQVQNYLVRHVHAYIRANPSLPLQRRGAAPMAATTSVVRRLGHRRWMASGDGGGGAAAAAGHTPPVITEYLVGICRVLRSTEYCCCCLWGISAWLRFLPLIGTEYSVIWTVLPILAASPTGEQHRLLAGEESLWKGPGDTMVLFEPKVTEPSQINR